MKKLMKPLSLACALLLLALSACGPAAPPEEPEAPEPLRLERLNLELSRNGLSPEALAQAVRDLPPALKSALADRGVAVETATVSVGASVSATVQAAAEGGVDAAILPAEAFAALETPPRLILAAGPVSPAENGEDRPGAPALICAAPTENGRALAEKARTDGLTWEDLAAVRWGVLEDSSLLGRQAVDLWLWDRYDGETSAHLALSVYDSYEDLLRAAAAEEIDVLPLWDGVRKDLAEAWTLAPSRTDGRGVRGLGRPAALEKELPVLGETERLYTSAAVVREDDGVLTDSRFAAALAAALESLREAFPVLGPYPYALAENRDLDPQRRLAGL